MHHGNPWFRAGRNAAEAGRHVGQEVDRVVAPLVQLQELVEVPACTEARSPACHGDDRGAGVGLSAGDLFVQGFDEGDVEGVAPLGTVDQQPPDGAALFDEQWFGVGSTWLRGGEFGAPAVAQQVALGLAVGGLGQDFDEVDRGRRSGP
ncbi:hypothetical protein [Streptomyces sasae]|uniref:hypothetical protein n=1 Tax=Streptomyces sasae TaxID=1266772 RepID=UPI00293054C0|nr:hypothetical protein [Streptomyces sasae]